MKAYLFRKVEFHKVANAPMAEFRSYPGHVFDNGGFNDRHSVLEFMTPGQCGIMLRDISENQSAMGEFNANTFNQALEAFESFRQSTRGTDTQDAPSEEVGVRLDL